MRRCVWGDSRNHILEVSLLYDFFFVFCFLCSLRAFFVSVILIVFRGNDFVFSSDKNWTSSFIASSITLHHIKFYTWYMHKILYVIDTRYNVIIRSFDFTCVNLKTLKSSRNGLYAKLSLLFRFFFPFFIGSMNIVRPWK